MERPDSFTFVLLAPGYCAKDFRARVVKRELKIDAPDFEVARPLWCRVDPAALETDYRNGVLSVRVPKRP